jgi:hypothetical protein
LAFMFENLQVYQKAVDLADRIASLTETFPRGYYFLVDQLNRAALSINPVPAFNMGLLFRALQDQQQAELWFQEARLLGCSTGVIDRIIQSSQTRFANIDGRGHS